MKYAKIRGIRVIPGVNGPGNVNILGKYPKFKEAIAWYRKPVVNGLAYGSPYGGIFNPLDDTSYEFYKNMMKEIHDSFECEYCHNSGIVPEYECIDSPDKIWDFLHKGGYHKKDLTQIFISKRKEALEGMKGHKMKNIYWYQNDGIQYEDDDILQFWGREGTLETELQRHPKNKFIISAGDRNINCGYLTPFGMNSRNCGGPIAPVHYHKFPNITDSARKQILGTEVLAWNEMSNEFDLLTKLNPHSGAVSSIYWNPDQKLSDASLKEVLMRLQYRLKAYGIPTSKVSMRYCEEHTHHCFGN